jgi:hypothetical protein
MVTVKSLPSKKVAATLAMAKPKVTVSRPARAASAKSVPRVKTATAPKPVVAAAKNLAPAAKAPDETAGPKPVKLKKPKLVRDSFTMPKLEYNVLDELKQRAIKLLCPAKKSELMRAGIKALASMPDNLFLSALKAVPAIKTGRPSKGDAD